MSVMYIEDEESLFTIFAQVLSSVDVLSSCSHAVVILGSAF